MGTVGIETERHLKKFMFDRIGEAKVVEYLLNLPSASKKTVYGLPTLIGLGFEQGDREAQRVVDYLVLYIGDAHPLQPHISKVTVDIAALVVAQRVRNELPRCCATC